MAKKKTRNKARDVFADYYKTNREVSKGNEEAQKKQGKKKGWSKSEITMTVIIILGAIGLVLRYIVFK